MISIAAPTKLKAIFLGIGILVLNDIFLDQGIWILELKAI